MTAADVLTQTVEHYQRDRPFRAPETVPEWQARLLSDLWSVLAEAQEEAASEAEGSRDAA